MALKKDIIEELKTVEKELSIREQHKHLKAVKSFRSSLEEDLTKTYANPDITISSAIYNILIKIGLYE